MGLESEKMHGCLLLKNSKWWCSWGANTLNVQDFHPNFAHNFQDASIELQGFPKVGFQNPAKITSCERQVQDKSQRGDPYGSRAWPLHECIGFLHSAADERVRFQELSQIRKGDLCIHHGAVRVWLSGW